MSTVLVTGGAGFIGSHLCERLVLLGYDVICLDNFNDSYNPQFKRQNVLRAVRHSGYRLVEGEILDAETIDKLIEQSKVDAIVHLAALAGVRSSILSPLDYVDVDIKGTVTLLEACKKHEIKKFVFASSSSVYGKGIPPFKEADPLGAQVSPYAAAKHCGELYCNTYHQLYGIPVVCLRFFTVYGPRQRPDMAIRIFTKAMLEDKEIHIFGGGNSTRDYTYIDDIVDGIIASIQLKCSFEAINLGNSNTTSILGLLEILENKLCKRANVSFLPEQQGDVPDTCADISKAAAMLGYAPKVRLEEGIEHFVEWYKKFRK